jgi:hypothetical protein
MCGYSYIHRKTTATIYSFEGRIGTVVGKRSILPKVYNPA